MIRRRSREDSVARCHEVARVLQAYLDGDVDDVTARRVARHLEACRRCGLEQRAYRALKAALARRTTTIDELALERVRTFALRLLDTPPAATGL
ncbi:MAG: zf-HC2 domain-containing protein [Acidimicrobiia bacterium]